MFFQRIARKLNKVAARYYLSFSQEVRCNLCGWQGAHFLSDNWHEHIICPQCNLEVRHRLLWASLTEFPAVSLEQLVKGKRILHFAAEPFLRQKLKPLAASYLTADFLRQDYDRQIDISHMPEIGDRSLDLLIACDVLEHVPEHNRAIAEIYRVLAPGGYALLTVPQKDHLFQTFEDGSITDPQERERIFGQVDHVRVYGDDFPQFLEKAGFEVTVVDKNCFPEALAQKSVFSPPQLSSHPLATNYRKIFLAQK